jgi:hypothetical protein
MPTPNSDEGREEFLERCMADEVMREDFPDEDQRYAVCERQWQVEGKMMQHKHMDIGLWVKEVTDDGIFSGYGSVFGNEDSMSEVIEKGAFEDSLKRHAQNGTMPAMLWQHDFRQVIGKYLEVKEDERGLYVKGQLAKTPRGKEALELLRMDALSGMSIGYMPQKYEIDEETDVLTHKEVDLWEVSLVTFPANQEARVSEVKAALGNGELPTKTKLEALLRNAGFSRRQAKGLIARGYEGLRQRGDADVGSEGVNDLIEKIRA